jgi:hypothetical protein
MRIQTNPLPQFSANRKPASSSRSGDERAPEVSGQDMLLLNRISSQERIMRASYALPWTGAAVGAAGVYYLAKTTVLSQFSAIGNHPGIWSGGLGLPVGLLLGAGLAEYLSNNAAVKVEEAEAQLSRNK